MPREKLPSRRNHWTQKVKIDNNSFYLTVGEYPDGRPGEIWIEAHKMGTFARGALDTAARAASLALQCGADIRDAIKILQGMCFPPYGKVEAEYTEVTEVTSIADWIAQELSNVYLAKSEVGRVNRDPVTVEEPNILPMVAEGDPLPPEKSAGSISRSVWS